MYAMFAVRVPLSCVLLRLCRDVVVVRPPSPRSDITAHSTWPPVPRCAVVCRGLQSEHQHVECDSRHRLRRFLGRFGLGCGVAAESQLSTDLWHPVLNGGPVRARGSDDDDDVATLLREREREKIKFTRDDEFQPSADLCTVGVFLRPPASFPDDDRRRLRCCFLRRP